MLYDGLNDDRSGYVRVEASPAPKYYAGPIKLVARRPDAPKVAGAAKPAAAEPPPEAAAPANDGHGH